MIDLFYRHVLIRGFESGVKRRKTYRYWRELDRSQWLPRDDLQSLQLISLKNLLEHAATRCSYYRDAWSAAGLAARELRSVFDLQNWPVIDRETIWRHRNEMRADLPGMRLIKKATGGSSGVPLEFDLDHGSLERRYAAWHRGYDWAGAGPGTRQWHLWGGAVGNPSRAKRLKDALYHRLYRRTLVNSFGLGVANLDTFLESLNHNRPHAIVAFTNPLYDFALALEERGLRPHSPRSIVVGAEKLHDFQREVIERVFRAPVFETYGSREFMLIGSECEQHSGLHLTAEDLIVEIVDDQGRPTPDGDEGNVVITDLTNYGMPFVRYQNGDRAIASRESCPCGRGLPLLKKVVGRQLDILDTPDGRRIPGEFFPHLIKEYPAIRRFQVVQDDLDLIQLRLVVRGQWTEALQSDLKQQIERVTGNGVRLEIAVVDDIPLTAAGKRKVVFRRLPSDRPISDSVPVAAS